MVVLPSELSFHYKLNHFKIDKSINKIFLFQKSISLTTGASLTQNMYNNNNLKQNISQRFIVIQALLHDTTTVMKADFQSLRYCDTLPTCSGNKVPTVDIQSVSDTPNDNLQSD